ncbi:MAG: hypothetical protein JSR47_14860 [Proteobacteria bacterium]|nr:hypothetical protein [Pseudomonadota bacterium]
MRDDALRATEAESLKPQAGEMHDLSLGAFRFLAAFLMGLAVLMIAGIL